MSRRYPPELHAFMAEFIPGHTIAEIQDEVNRRFNVGMTYAGVKSYLNNHKIRTGTAHRPRAGLPSKVFPEPVYSFLMKNGNGTSVDDMLARIESELGFSYERRQIAVFYKNHKLRSGVDCRFQKGRVPANKGKKIKPHENSVATQFKAGHKPHNKRPIGTVLVKSDGYLWRKISDSCRGWRQEHILVWEEANGPIPKGHKITFLDGDRLNVSLDNLCLVTDAANSYMTTKKLRFKDAELTKAGAGIAELQICIQKAVKA